MTETRDSRDQRPSITGTPLDLTGTPHGLVGTPLDLVGTTLRQVYEADAAEPLPQSFEDLLRQLL